MTGADISIQNLTGQTVFGYHYDYKGNCWQHEFNNATTQNLLTIQIGERLKLTLNKTEQNEQYSQTSIVLDIQNLGSEIIKISSYTGYFKRPLPNGASYPNETEAEHLFPSEVQLSERDAYILPNDIAQVTASDGMNVYIQEGKPWD